MNKLKETKNIFLQKNNILVTEIKNFYSSQSDKKSSFTVSENENVKVGYIEKGDSKEFKEGTIVYYMAGNYVRINLKGVGKFHLVDKSTIFAVDTSKNLNNY